MGGDVSLQASPVEIPQEVNVCCVVHGQKRWFTLNEYLQPGLAVNVEEVCFRVPTRRGPCCRAKRRNLTVRLGTNHVTTGRSSDFQARVFCSWKVELSQMS